MRKDMSKRLSLGDAMKAISTPSAPPAAPMPTERAGGQKPYYAATREGLKRITVAVSPAEHKRLKRLAVEAERSIEHLMKEALDDLFAKHGA
jgi:hypothetical protein